nr:DUF4892 domain-containing protein [Marinibactrum halimedae]
MNVNGRWQTERSEKLTGVLTRTVYELNNVRDIGNVFSDCLTYLQDHNADPLYRCKGHNCGSSGTWANDHFGQRSLYGLEQYQHYAAVQLRSESATTFIALYGVTRGNRRSYLLVDEFTSTLTSTSSLLPQAETLETYLKEQGHIRVPLSLDGTEANISNEFIKILARALKQAPTLNIVIVSSDYRSKKLEDNINASTELAKKTMTALEEQGVNTSRLKAHGIGNLQPRIHAELETHLEPIPDINLWVLRIQ